MEQTGDHAVVGAVAVGGETAVESAAVLVEMELVLAVDSVEVDHAVVAEIAVAVVAVVAAAAVVVVGSCCGTSTTFSGVFSKSARSSSLALSYSDSPAFEVEVFRCSASLS